MKAETVKDKVPADSQTGMDLQPVTKPSAARLNELQSFAGELIKFLCPSSARLFIGVNRKRWALRR